MIVETPYKTAIVPIVDTIYIDYPYLKILIEYPTATLKNATIVV